MNAATGERNGTAPPPTLLKVSIPNKGTVSAVLATPPSRGRRRATCVVLAHGAGNDMHGPLLSAVHTELAARGFTCVKFNFPYKERGQRPPDRAPVLVAAYRAVLDTVRDRIAPATIVIGGKSLGARMASHLAAEGEAVDGLLFLGYPLHPAGKPEKRRDAHLPRIKAPMLFFAGTRDPLCRLELLRNAVRLLQTRVDVHIVDGADHSFQVLKSMKRDARDVYAEIVGVSTGWLDRLGK